jgi:MOSC domain-containing protein YiiM
MLSGKILNLYVKRTHGAPMEEVCEVTAVDGQGLRGDSNYGRSKRQVLLIEQETLGEFGLVTGQLKENAVVSGVVLAGLVPGSQIQAGEVVLEVTGDCAPCQYIEDLRPGLREAITGRRGTLCRVVTGGLMRVGDQVDVA